MNIPPPTMHNTQSLSQSCHTVLLIRPLQFFLPSLNLIFRNLPEHLPLPKTIEVFRAVIVSILLLTSVRYPAKYYKCTLLNKYDNARTVLYLLSICRKQNLPNQNTDTLRQILETFYQATGKLRPYRLLLNIKFNEVKANVFRICSLLNFRLVEYECKGHIF